MFKIKKFSNQLGSMHIMLLPLFILLAIGGIFVLLNTTDSIAAKKPRPTPTVKPSPSPSLTPTPTPSPCSNSVGNVEVTQPNGGEQFITGNQVTIKWCVNQFSQYNQSNSSIWLASRQTQVDGTFVYQNQLKIADNVLMTAGANSYNWVIPQSVSNGGSYVILVGINSLNPNFDYSNNTFTITSSSSSPTPSPTSNTCANSVGNVEVKQPNGGERFVVGNQMTISWCVNQYSQYNQTYSSIWLATRTEQADGSPIYRNQVQIANNLLMTAGSNSHNWIIPSSVLNGNNYVILVGINSINPNFDYSDGVFAINP